MWDTHKYLPVEDGPPVHETLGRVAVVCILGVAFVGVRVALAPGVDLAHEGGGEGHELETRGVDLAHEGGGAGVCVNS